MAEEKKEKIIPIQKFFYFDFDGTLTALIGKHTVFGAFYQSLFEGFPDDVNEVVVDKNFDYAHVNLKPSNKVQDLMKIQYDKGEEFRKTFMTPKAIEFLGRCLSDPQTRVVILTRNNTSYIQELLNFHQFSEEQIKKITFYEHSRKNKDIETDLLKNLHESQPKEDKIRIEIHYFDDTQNDFNAMDIGVGNVIQKRKNAYTFSIRGVHVQVGGHDWEAESKISVLEEKKSNEVEEEEKGYLTPYDDVLDDLNEDESTTRKNFSFFGSDPRETKDEMDESGDEDAIDPDPKFL